MAFDADGAGAAFDGFEGVFDLEDVAVGAEDAEGAVVAGASIRDVSRVGDGVGGLIDGLGGTYAMVGEREEGG